MALWEIMWEWWQIMGSLWRPNDIDWLGMADGSRHCSWCLNDLTIPLESTK